MLWRLLICGVRTKASLSFSRVENNVFCVLCFAHVGNMAGCPVELFRVPSVAQFDLADESASDVCMQSLGRSCRFSTLSSARVYVCQLQAG